MVILSGIRDLLHLYKEARNSYDIWRTYEGEEIVIISSNWEELDEENKPRGFLQYVEYRIQGTVENVMSRPPGFLLKDVKEEVRMVDRQVDLKFSPDSPGPQPQPKARGTSKIKEIDKKFITFSSIKEIEFAE